MKVLGINTCHDPSIALCVDGQITQYYEEVRFRKQKRWDPIQIPDLIKYLCFDKIDMTQVDIVSYSLNAPQTYWIVDKLQEYLKNPVHYANPKHHHLYHAVSGFYFSKFDDAMCIIIDGGGSLFNLNTDDYETESLYFIDKKIIERKYVHFSEGWKFTSEHEDYYGTVEALYDRLNAIRVNKPITFSSVTGPGMFFDGISKKYLHDGHAAGKLMGLASYSMNEPKLKYLREAIDLGKKAQQYLLDTTICLIERAISYNQTSNIVLSGGCALNCVNNFKLVKMFPMLNFFIDPIAHDGSQAIGAAIYYHDYHRQETSS